MKPISPVIPGENFEEIIVAEHQDEYFVLQEGVQELAKAIEIKNASRN